MRRHRAHPAALALAVLAGVGCAATRGEDADRAPSAGQQAAPATAPGEDAANPASKADDARHRVVFADRISQGYLLLLPPAGHPPAIGRDDVVALLDRHAARWEANPEASLLFEMARTDPDSTRIDPARLGQTDEDLARAAALRTKDVLGLAVEVLPLAEPGEPPLVDPALLRDPILARDLPPDERARFAQATHALLLRGEYRNAHDVRGLRLLQAIVDVVAHHYGAAVFDFDTKETVRPDTFTRRLFRKDLYNVADQIVVVPLPGLSGDPSGSIRLVTRGMRRFGVPDLELAPLPKDPALLQDGTHLLMGLARVLAREAALDPSGYARQADDVLEVHYRDVDAAYAGRGAHLPHCDECPETTAVHLVRRPPAETDARGHPVVRVTAPRPASDAPGYDPEVWIRQALADLFGRR